MESTPDIVTRLQNTLGPSQLLTHDDDKAWYLKGFRVGRGKALAVTLPHTLMELWQILQACVETDTIVLMQASNTGVTGGSTPDGDNYDRPLVIVSTRLLKGVQVIDHARQVIALPGSTLTELENALRPHHKEPHSVIGSSCIGASVIGGVCNNSGGSLIRRGPAFTEKSLYAQITAEGELQLVNHLGIDLGSTPEEMIRRLEQQQYVTGHEPDWQGKIWADDYATILRDVTADSPARYNGDPNYLYDSAGCAGKLAVFAVRLATFDASEKTATLYIGTHDEQELIALRRFLLENLRELPLQAEYIHRNAFDLTVRYAKHMYRAIDRFGAEALPSLLARKARWDIRVKNLRVLPHNAVDKLLQLANRVTPKAVAPRILQWRDRFEHHLMIKCDARDSDELESMVSAFFSTRNGDYFRCSEREQKDAFLVRFGVGACTIAYCDYFGMDTNQRLVAFDVALRRNDSDWRIKLPPHLADQVLEESCCGHFFCLVNHQDYILKPGVDAATFKQAVIACIEARGARYPAEHNVGHLYHASHQHQQHWQQLDPTNSYNPGIGKTSKKKFWQ